MKNLIKVKVFLLVFTIFFSSQSIAANQIFPQPKPLVDEDTKAKTAKKKEIYPQKKPGPIKKKNQADVSKSVIEVIDDNKDEVFIYPVKKPLIVQKKIDKALKRNLEKQTPKVEVKPVTTELPEISE